MYYINSYSISDFQNSSFPISLKACKILGAQNAIIYSYLLGVFIANHQRKTIDQDGFFCLNKTQMFEVLLLNPEDIDNAISRLKQLELCIEKNEEVFKLKLTHPLYEITGLSGDYFDTSFFEQVDDSTIKWITEHKDYLLKRQVNISLLITVLDEYSQKLSKEDFEQLKLKIINSEAIYNFVSFASLRATIINLIDGTLNFVIYPGAHIEFTFPSIKAITND